MSTESEWFTSIAVDADRRERRRARRVGELLAVTAQVIGEQGYMRTTLDDIAERLDLAKASIYHYFDSKESLVLAMLASCHTYVVGRLTAIAESDGPAAARLRGMVAEQVALSTREIPHFIQLFLRPMEWSPPLAEAIKRFREENDDVYRRVIDDGVARGEFHLADPSVTRLCMQGALSFVPSWFKSSSPDDAEVLVNTIMVMFTGDRAAVR